MATKIQLRGGTAAQWTAANPILSEREAGIETDTRKQKFGDGITAWNSLSYAGALAAWGSISGTLTDQSDLNTALGLKLDKSKNYIEVACSDETTALTAGTAKITFRMPYAMTVTAVRASLVTAQASGNIFTIDINEGGTSILSTKLTIDNTEKTSTTAATPAVISDANIADDAEITIDIDQIGNGSATGLKVKIYGS